MPNRMDRRTVAGAVFTSVFTLGGGAVIAALQLPDGSPYTTALIATGVVMAVVGLAGLLGLLLIPAAKPTTDSRDHTSGSSQTKTLSDGVIDQSVTSFNQSGGITAHTLNLGPPRRILDDNGRNDLLHKIPQDRIIHVECVHGDAEADHFAQQVWDFLKRAGRPMAGGGPDYFIKAPPAYGERIDLTRDPNRAWVIIGSRE